MLQLMKITIAGWIGSKRGRLTVVECVAAPHGDLNGGGLWKCKCVCGREVVKTGYRLSPIKPDSDAGCSVGCGASKRPSPLTDVQMKEAVEMYQSGESLHVIAKHFDVYVQSIWKPMKRAGVVMRSLSQAGRRFPVNENVFSEISERSAYWAGFLMADGNVQKGSKDSYLITLGLSVVDRAHVEKFRDLISPQAVVSTRHMESGDSCTFRFRSKKAGEDLIRLGVTERKTFTAKACDALAFNRHFWRGVVDGDGSIGQQDGYWHVSLVGSEVLVGQFAAFCGTVIPEFEPSVNPTGNIFRLSVAGRKAATLLDALHHGSSVALDRKRLLAAQAIAAGNAIETDRALINTPQRRPRNLQGRYSLRPVTVGAETGTIGELAARHGHSVAAVYTRTHRLDWPLDRALTMDATGGSAEAMRQWFQSLEGCVVDGDVFRFGRVGFVADASRSSPSDRTKATAWKNLRRQQAAKAVGDTLFFFRVEEWEVWPVLIQDWVRHKLIGGATTCYARDCEKGPLDADSAAMFYAGQHLQSGQGGKHFALKHGGQVVAVMTFSAQSQSRQGAMVEGEWTLARYAVSGHVPGAASRLFKLAVAETTASSVVSFSDNAYSDGELYRSLGFTMAGTTPPDYKVWHPETGILHKSAWRRKNIPTRLDEAGLADDFKPETDIRSESDMERLAGCSLVWDCGKLRWKWSAPISTGGGQSNGEEVETNRI